jgi:2,3-diaminopropionate biosynthesis protein SbnA
MTKILLERIERIEPFIGRTPLKELNFPGIKAYAKLEYANFSGSLKDRAAYYIMREAIKKGQVKEGFVVVESSSGNFAISLMSMCLALKIRFIPVIDVNINAEYEKILRLCCDVVKITEPDETGGYLLNRIKKVREICESNKDSYWPNQYSNPLNYLSYYFTLGVELCAAFEELDYVFLAASTAGTITGVSKRIKEKFPSCKIIGVDIEGSLTFGGIPGKRFISGLGASKKSEFLANAEIDELIYVSHSDIIEGCRDLLKEQVVFGGGSSGACYSAMKRFFKGGRAEKSVNAVIICPDKGNAYLNNIYDDAWVKKVQALLSVENVLTF